MISMDDIKRKWFDLEERERKMLFYGGIALVILLVYWVVWSPISDAVSDRKAVVHSRHRLLQYLQGAAVEVQALRAQGVSVTPASQVNVLTVAEQTLSENQLQSSLKQVQQPQSNQVQLTFQAVQFDKLLHWVQQLVMTQGFSVEQFNAKRTGTAGMADVVVTLKAGS